MKALKLEILSSEAGPTIVLNGYRIAGVKPGRGTRTVKCWQVTLEDLGKALAGDAEIEELKHDQAKASEQSADKEV